MSTTPEALARQKIDAQLVAAGWLLQDRDEMNRLAGPGVVVREFPMAGGFCDYLLIVGGRACGVIEAKAAGTTLSGVALQSAGYLTDASRALAKWSEPLRFGYEANGGEVQFADRADPDPRSRRLFSFHRPETLLAWLQAASSLRGRLQALPALAPAGLRACQVEAIAGIEASLKAGRPRALVQMATGAGKTFTAATLCYRLLAHAGAARILFLVDRNNLGRQTLKEFQTYRPPGTGHLFTELYNVQRLGPAGLERESKVVISTIQRVYAQLTGETLAEEEEEQSGFESRPAPPRAIAYSARLPIETFDIVLIDECHRSIYGDWRPLLDYFDAFLIGLTATPTPHTLGFFGRNLVAEYPYDRSVIDLVNVGFEVFRIRTGIGEHGATVEKGYTLPVRDKHSRAQGWRTLEEDLVYAPADLDRSVVARNQIRTVLAAYRASLFTELFPGRHEVPKTLIFAKDDNHAEEIVAIAREVFDRGNDFAQKITYRLGTREAEDMISRFRNAYEPRIAVTVDMIATGTDVKAIEVLIFLRDVRSATYFEQMRGRGVRAIAPEELRKVTPDAPAKERFVLIDAVGVTDSLKTVSRPLERERKLGFGKLLEQIAAGRADEDAVATLAARLAALASRLAPEDLARVHAVAGAPLPDLARALVDALDEARLDAAARAAATTPPAADEAREPSPEAREAVAQAEREAALLPFNDPALRKLLVELKTRSEIVIDELSPDAVLSCAFDPRAAEKLTGDFRRFLDENSDRLAALTLLYHRPAAEKRLTYAGLAELRAAMLAPPWLLEPAALWSAYRRLKGGQVRGTPARTLTDIIALVRFALGESDTLAPFSATVAQRFNLWLGREQKAGRTYDAPQRAWLEAIRDYLAANVEIGLPDVQEAFADRGGVAAARRAFGAHLPGLLEDLAETLVA
mgnify:CR=1 FL=1